jgi:hypothetical protein
MYKYGVIHTFVKHFKNSQQIDSITDHGNSYADRERNSSSLFTYLTDAFTFGNTADIYAIIHLVPHSCQHTTADPRHSSGDTVAKILTFTERHIWYYCLLAANQGNCVHGLFFDKNLESFSLYRRKNYHDPLRSLFIVNF